MLRDLFSLFPAYAGVIPRKGYLKTARTAFPRICGGDPYGQPYFVKADNFSPHMRG